MKKQDKHLKSTDMDIKMFNSRQINNEIGMK